MNEIRRMMQRVLKNNLPERLLIVLLILMMAGMVFSRALLSLSSVGLGALFIISPRKADLDVKCLIAVFLLLLPPIVSGFWSDNKALWLDSVSVKIPLLTMLLGLSVTPVSKRNWQGLVFAFVVIISLGCIWSLFNYLSETSVVNQSYLRAKVMTTPADNDYVRFSWMVVTAVFLGVKYILMRNSRRSNYIMSGLVVFLVIYLHILAAKTGLLCFYTGCGIYILYKGIAEKKWKSVVVLFAVVVAGAILAYASFPTLRNRVQYVMYDFGNYSKGNFIPGYNDAARWLSVKAGYDILQENPLTGVGFGDINTAVAAWHSTHHPSSFTYERFSPTNEWLIYGAGSGWPGLLLFTAGMGILFYYTTKRDAISFMLAATACIPFLTDDSLEGQYGVILLAFIAFFGQQKFLKQEPVL